LKTLAEIAIEAGLVTKAGVVKAGRLAEERKQPLVAMLIREIGIDEVALVGAVRKQTRVPLLDPAGVQVDPEALRIVSRDDCFRLRVLPLGVGSDGKTRVLRVAMADPTDTRAILELEQIASCEIEVAALPLSAIEELLDKGYKQFSTAVVSRPRPHGDNVFVTGKVPRVPQPIDATTAEASEISVTAQIPLSSLQPEAGPEMRTEQKLLALCELLIAKGLITQAELAEALDRLKSKP
jgi:hypothetical protein